MSYAMPSRAQWKWKQGRCVQPCAKLTVMRQTNMAPPQKCRVCAVPELLTTSPAPGGWKWIRVI